MSFFHVPTLAKTVNYAQLHATNPKTTQMQPYSKNTVNVVLSTSM